MEKYFLLNNINKQIIHPITLSFLNEEIYSQYIEKVFDYKYYIFFSIFELLISIITIISCIFSYFISQSILNNIRLFISLLTTMFLLINILFFHFGKNSPIYRKILIIFGTSIHIFSYKLSLYILLSITYYDNYLLFEKITPLCSLSEVFIAMCYIIFIDNTFITHFFIHLISIFLIFIIETFLSYNINFSFIFLFSFISSFLIVLICYFHEKYQKINWFLNYRRIKDVEYYGKIFLDNTVILVSFKKNDVYNFNPSLRYIMEQSYLKEDLEKLFNSKNESEKEGLNPKSLVNEELNIIIKKLIFSKLNVKNENISNIIKEHINNLDSSDKNFIERINTFFSIIRDNKDKFNNVTYIGTINFENTEKQYSIFIQVNPYNNQINYFAIALDFPIEVSHNVEILSKISILNSKITHEIKNPLAAIQSLVSEIKTFIENTGINEIMNKLDSIYNYSEYMKYITKDFEFLALKLNNLREVNNITEVDIKRVNFELIVNFSVDLIKNIWKNKNSKVLIKKEIDKEISDYINTDEIRVKQIIINLLSNSLKFTKMGSVTLVCSNYDEDYILIMVKDTGIGMKEEQVEKLNQNGTLFLKSNTNNKFGSGLGLSVVKDMIKILGKNFKVESKYNEGTRISFLLNKNINKTIESNQNIIINENHRKINLITNIDASTSALTLNNDSNINLNNNNNDDIKININQYEELTKRENFLLIKPVENYHCVQTTIYTKNSKNFDPKYLDINNKRKSCFNIYRNRISFLGKQNSNNDSISESNNEVKIKKKIYALVVEDEQVLRNCNINLITKYFNEKGIDISIEESTDGIECIYKIYKGFNKEIKYQFIVCDEQMNIMNGNMMTNIIRSLIEENRFYPIKIYSSSGNNFVDDSFKKNYEGIFSKPLTIDNVIDIFKDNIELEDL